MNKKINEKEALRMIRVSLIETLSTSLDILEMLIDRGKYTRFNEVNNNYRKMREEIGKAPSDYRDAGELSRIDYRHRKLVERMLMHLN